MNAKCKTILVSLLSVLAITATTLASALSGVEASAAYTAASFNTDSMTGIDTTSIANGTVTPNVGANIQVKAITTEYGGNSKAELTTNFTGVSEDQWGIMIYYLKWNEGVDSVTWSWTEGPNGTPAGPTPDYQFHSDPNVSKGLMATNVSGDWLALVVGTTAFPMLLECSTTNGVSTIREVSEIWEQDSTTAEYDYFFNQETVVRLGVEDTATGVNVTASYQSYGNRSSFGEMGLTVGDKYISSNTNLRGEGAFGVERVIGEADFTSKTGTIEFLVENNASDYEIGGGSSTTGGDYALDSTKWVEKKGVEFDAEKGLIPNVAEDVKFQAATVNVGGNSSAEITTDYAQVNGSWGVMVYYLKWNDGVDGVTWSYSSTNATYPFTSSGNGLNATGAKGDWVALVVNTVYKPQIYECKNGVITLKSAFTAVDGNDYFGLFRQKSVVTLKAKDMDTGSEITASFDAVALGKETETVSCTIDNPQLWGEGGFRVERVIGSANFTSKNGTINVVVDNVPSGYTNVEVDESNLGTSTSNWTELTNADVNVEKGIYAKSTQYVAMTQAFDGNISANLVIDYTDANGSWGAMLIYAKYDRYVDYVEWEYISKTEGTVHFDITSTGGLAYSNARGSWVALCLSHGGAFIIECENGVLTKKGDVVFNSDISGLFKQRNTVTLTTEDTADGTNILFTYEANKTGGLGVQTFTYEGSKFLRGAQNLRVEGVKGGHTPSLENNFMEVRVQESATPSTYDSMLSVAPTAVADILTASDLSVLNTSAKPRSAILYFDNAMNVVDKDGGSLGMLDEVYGAYIDGNVLPVFYVRSQEQADGLSAWLVQNSTVEDAFVMSSSEYLVRSVRSKVNYIRGVWDCSGGVSDWNTVVATANSFNAGIVVLSETEATRENVAYLQARLKTVWVKASCDTTMRTVETLNTGVYGVITDNILGLYETYTLYASEILPMTRTPFNIAHRGLATEAENSYEAVVAAHEAGVTHIEIDITATKNGEVVLMHDSTMARNCAKKSDAEDQTDYLNTKITELTLEQVRTYQIVKTGTGVACEGVEIPLLTEVLDYLYNTDVVLVIEIKENISIVGALATTLADYNTAYPERNIYKNIIMISFLAHGDFSAKLPQIPYAILSYQNEIYTSIDGVKKACSLNAAVDLCYQRTEGSSWEPNHRMTQGDMRYLADRGFLPYFYTYSSAYNVKEGYENDTLGITNDAADTMSTYANTLEIADGGKYIVGDLADIEQNGYNLAFVALDPDTPKDVSEKSSIFYAEKGTDYIDAIFKRTYTATTGLQYTIFSDKIRVISAEAYMSVADINALLNKDLTTYTVEDKANIYKVERAYAVLDEVDKAAVDLSKLDDIIQSIERAAAVDTLIAAIPTGALTAENYATTKTAVEAAEKAYAALSEEERALVENGQALTEARNALDTHCASHLTATAAAAPTCTKTGNTAYYTCDICGKYYADETAKTEIEKDSWLLPVTEHTYDSVVTAPTCTEKGYTTYTCKNCDDTYTADETDALGHTEEVDEAVEPTCTETGLTAGKHCSVCGETLEKQETVEATGHNYDSVVTAPTCTEKGYTTYTCKNCDDTYTADETDALGHTEEVDEAVEPTCTETGLTAGKHCSVCGETLEKQETMEATGHDYNSVVTAPTCTEKGYTTYTCKNCDDTYTDNETDALGHTEEIDEAVEPTCTETGLTAGKHCLVCGEILVGQTIVGATGHSDEMADHNCDICGEKLTDCKDENQDGACDICGKTMGGLTAEAVQEMIAALTGVEGTEIFEKKNSYTRAYEAYLAAKEAYYALSEADRENVTNSAKLEEVKAELEAFRLAVDKAEAVDALIETIPTSEITTANYEVRKAQIERARAAYEELTAEEKAYCTKLDYLENREEALSKVNLTETQGCSASIGGFALVGVALAALACMKAVKKREE